MHQPSGPFETLAKMLTVHDHRDPLSVLSREDVVEEGGFTRPEVAYTIFIQPKAIPKKKHDVYIR
jgi:hypothetical protein